MIGGERVDGDELRTNGEGAGGPAPITFELVLAGSANIGCNSEGPRGRLGRLATTPSGSR